MHVKNRFLFSIPFQVQWCCWRYPCLRRAASLLFHSQTLGISPLTLQHSLRSTWLPFFQVRLTWLSQINARQTGFQVCFNSKCKSYNNNHNIHQESWWTAHGFYTINALRFTTLWWFDIYCTCAETSCNIVCRKTFNTEKLSPVVQI